MSEKEVTKTLIDNIKTFFTSKNAIYLGIAVIIIGAIYYFKFYKKNNPPVYTNPPINTNPPVYTNPPINTNPPVNTNPLVNRPTQVEFAPELLNDLKKNNITPEQYLVMLQQKGELPPGELPKIIYTTPQNNEPQIIPHTITQNYQKIEDDNEDDNIKEEKLTKEEIDDIQTRLNKMNTLN